MVSWPGRSFVLVLLLAPLAVLMGGLAVHAFRALVLGRAPLDEDLAGRGSSLLLGHTVRQGFAWTVSPVERALAASGVSADALTLAGTAVCSAGAFGIAAGDLTVGGLLVLLSAAFDYLDGRIARSSGTQSVAGAFLDSTLDRWSDAACFGAAAFLLRANAASLVAGLVALGAASIVPYARAKAESLGVDLKGGLMQRPERLVLMSAAAIFSAPLDALWPAPIEAVHPTFTAAVWLLAALTLGTAVSRTREGLRRLRGVR